MQRAVNQWRGVGGVPGRKPKHSADWMDCRQDKEEEEETLVMMVSSSSVRTADIQV